MVQKNKLSVWISEYGYRTVVCIIFLFLILVMSFNCYGASISGDEYFSLGFANNTEDFLFLSQGVIEKYSTDNWLKGDFLRDWISVQEDGKFAIMSIHRNVRNDVHPPLYFMFLNCISSFFVDEVTLFPGYFINVVSGTFVCIFAYLIMRKIFKDKWVALLPVLFWTVSYAGSITMTYIRMYAPLCALVMFCLYLHILYMEQKNVRMWTMIMLLGCTTVGTLTHYYYYIAQFVLFVVMVFYLLFHKQIKRLFCYGMSLLIGEIVSVAAYPYVVKHLLYSERGMQVQENLANYDSEYYIDFFKAFMDTFNLYVFDGTFKKLFLIFVVCAIAVVIWNMYRKKEIPAVNNKEGNVFVNSSGLYNLLLVVILAVGYFGVLFKISYSSRWLYISPVFPLIGILTIAGFVILLGKTNIKHCGLILFIVGAVFWVPKGIARIDVGISSNEAIRIQHEEITSYSEYCDVLFLFDEWNNLYDNQILELMEFDQICALAINDVEKTDFHELLLSRNDQDDFIIYIPTDVDDYQQKIMYIAEKLGVREPLVISETHHAIYLLKINE